MFVLQTKHIFSSSHLRFSKLFSFFPLLFNLSFRTDRPDTNITLVCSFLINIATSIMPLAISSADSLFLRLLVPTCNMIESGELSSKKLLIWCFIPFVVAPGIDFTASEDFILLLSLHPSIFFTIECPTFSVFFRFVPPLFCDVIVQIRWFMFNVMYDLMYDLSLILLLRDIVSLPLTIMFKGYVWRDFLFHCFNWLSWYSLIFFWLTSLFEWWIFLFSLLWLSLNLTAFSKKRVIMVFLLFISSGRK